MHLLFIHFLALEDNLEYLDNLFGEKRKKGGTKLFRNVDR